MADYLVKEGYTATERRVIEGGSAGGLLIDAVLNLRPDLCHAAGLPSLTARLARLHALGPAPVCAHDLAPEVQ